MQTFRIFSPKECVSLSRNEWCAWFVLKPSRTGVIWVFCRIPCIYAIQNWKTQITLVLDDNWLDDSTDDSMTQTDDSMTQADDSMTQPDDPMTQTDDPMTQTDDRSMTGGWPVDDRWLWRMTGRWPMTHRSMTRWPTRLPRTPDPSINNSIQNCVFHINQNLNNNC